MLEYLWFLHISRSLYYKYSQVVTFLPSSLTSPSTKLMHTLFFVICSSFLFLDILRRSRGSVLSLFSHVIVPFSRSPSIPNNVLMFSLLISFLWRILTSSINISSEPRYKSSSNWHISTLVWMIIFIINIACHVLLQKSLFSINVHF